MTPDPIRCLIVDDEQYAVDNLAEMIADTPFLVTAAIAKSGAAALDLLAKEHFDLMFLDMHMPGLSGLDLLQIVSMPVIMVTAHSHYAIYGYEHDVVDYLLKPFSYTRFLKAAQKAAALLKGKPAATISSTAAGQPETRDYLFINGEHKGKKIKIAFSDIVYLESERRYLIFHCASGKHITPLPLKEVAQMLLPHGFVRIHNSVIVPVSRIAAIDGNELTLRHPNGKSLRLVIGITYKAALMRTLGS